MILTSFDLIPKDYNVPENFSEIYTDVREDEWYAKFVAKCHYLRLMSAYASSKPKVFEWNRPMIRSEVANVINAAYQYKISCTN